MPPEHQPKNVLKQLRQLVPPRRLRYHEAQSLTEHQAHCLRQLLGVTEPELLEETLLRIPRLGIERKVDLPVSGMAHWHNGRWIVTLNALEPDTRQRFSLAHELFHIVNHTTWCWLHAGDGHFSAHQSGERLADYFAACLLMPKRHVKALAASGHGLTQLAAAFDVSLRAMEIRLRNLNISTRPSHRPDREGGAAITPKAPYYRRSRSCPPCLEGATA